MNLVIRVFFVYFLSCNLFVECNIHEEIEKSLEKIDRGVSGMHDEIATVVWNSTALVKRQIGTVSDTLLLNTIQSSLTTIGSSLQKFYSSDPWKQASGALDIIAAGTAVIPIVGPVISGMIFLLSSVCGLVGQEKSQTGIGEIVSKAVIHSLNQYDDANLKAEAWSLKDEFSFSQAFLNSMIFADLSSTELTAMSCHVPIYRGVRFFGILEYKIAQNKNIKNNMAVPRRAVEYVHLYSALATSREAIYQQMYLNTKSFGRADNIANAIQAIVSHTKINEQGALQFLFKPKPENAEALSYFIPSQFPEVVQFMKTRNVPLQSTGNLPGQNHHNRYLVSYENMYVCVSAHIDSYGGYLKGESCSEDHSFFRFESVSPETDNYFTLKLAKKNYIVYSEDGVNVKVGQFNPGSAGIWKVIYFTDEHSESNNFVMLFSKNWPKKYMCISHIDKIVRLVSGVPEYCAYFKHKERLERSESCSP